MLRKGTLASPAVAFASRVLPVPGGPTNRAPLGILAPSSLYLPGTCRARACVGCLLSQHRICLRSLWALLLAVRHHQASTLLELAMTGITGVVPSLTMPANGAKILRTM